METQQPVAVRPASQDLVSRLYTRPSELEARQASQRTKERIAEVIRFARPSEALLTQLLTQPLVLSRYIATPNFELFRFLELAEEVRRPPLIQEICFDWFAPAANPSKLRLAKLRIASSNPRACCRYVPVTSFSAGRRRFREVLCNDGQSLTEFHHQLVSMLIGPGLLEGVVDNGLLIEDDAPPRERYERMFALYTCLGALAENYLCTDAEGEFTEQVVLPALEATERRFGATPMIVELLPRGAELDVHWETYPQAVLELALQASAQ